MNTASILAVSRGNFRAVVNLYGMEAGSRNDKAAVNQQFCSGFSNMGSVSFHGILIFVTIFSKGDELHQHHA